VRLLQVDWNWVDVERAGIRQEIRLGSGEGIRRDVRVGSSQGSRPETRLGSIGAEAARGEAATVVGPDAVSAGVQRALELRAQKVAALMEWRARQQRQKHE
jgi:hypothetical protein